MLFVANLCFEHLDMFHEFWMADCLALYLFQTCSVTILQMLHVLPSVNPWKDKDGQAVKLATG